MVDEWYKNELFELYPYRLYGGFRSQVTGLPSGKLYRDTNCYKGFNSLPSGLSSGKPSYIV